MKLFFSLRCKVFKLLVRVGLSSIHNFRPFILYHNRHFVCTNGTLAFYRSLLETVSEVLLGPPHLIASTLLHCSLVNAICLPFGQSLDTPLEKLLKLRFVRLAHVVFNDVITNVVVFEEKYDGLPEKFCLLDAVGLFFL